MMTPLGERSVRYGPVKPVEDTGTDVELRENSSADQSLRVLYVFVDEQILSPDRYVRREKSREIRRSYRCGVRRYAFAVGVLPQVAAPAEEVRLPVP